MGVAILSALALAGCDREAAPTSTPEVAPASVDFPFCGGALKPGAARAYFVRLEQALDSGQPVPMSFYHETIVIQSEGQSLTFRRDDFSPGAEALLSNAQWREIAGRGLGDLHSVGWRGCILADGKAGFQSDANGEMGLSSFDRDRGWSPAQPG